MMVSTKGRYALRVMMDLAEYGNGEFLPLKETARRQGISLKYLESIMAELTRAGLVAGRHGKGGGYRLIRPPQEYTAAEILKAAEGSLAPVACLECGAKPCERAAACRTLPMWSKLDELIDGYLSSVTLQNLLDEKPLERKEPV